MARPLAALLTALGICLAGAACGGGLIGSLVDLAPPGPGVSVRGPGVFRPASSALDDPAAMAPPSPVVSFEYTTENILRTRTNGRLTEDMTTSGKSETLFVPMRRRGQTTVLAFSHTSDSADLFYDDPVLGGHLLWNLGSSGWALGQTLGKMRLGLTGSAYSGQADGDSVYPQQVFHIFSGSTDTRFDVSGSRVEFQAEYPLSANLDLRLSRGGARSDYGVRFTSAASQLALPVGVNAVLNGIALDNKLSHRLCAGISYQSSIGDGSDYITLNSVQEGRLDSHTHCSSLDVSASYRTTRGNQWRVGTSSVDRVLDLRGAGIRGKSLGMSLQPFNDKIDFNGRISILDTCFYAGTEHAFSGSWKMAAYYKRATLRSSLDVDYSARGFLGLIGVSDSYGSAPFILRGQGVQLAATYSRRAFSVNVQIEQLLPLGTKSASSAAAPSTGPADVVKTLGGTSLSMSCSYGY